MQTKQMLRSAFTTLVLLAAGCNANVLGGRDCDNPDGCADSCDPNDPSCVSSDELDGLIIMPAPVTLTSLNGSQPTQQFTVFGHRKDGGQTGPLHAQFSAPSNSIGIIDAQTGLFTAGGEVGGPLVLSAKLSSKQGGLSTNFQLTVNIVRNEIVPGTPTDAGTRFSGVPVDDSTKSAKLVYPLDGVVMPQNVYPADIQWTGGVAGDLYRVTLKKPNVTITAYTLHTGGAFGYHYLPQGKAWSGLAQSNPDSDATLTVDRWDANSGTAYSGKTFKMHFAKGSLLGSIYYWDIAAGRIRRIDDGTANRVDFMPNPPLSPLDGASCVGCHVVSRDGRYMVGRLGGGSNVAGVFDLTKNLMANPAPSEYPISSALPQFFISSFSPDNSRLIASEFNQLMLVNTKSGAAVAPAGGTLPTDGAYPNWSPDGKRIAYISSANDWGGEVTAGNLSILPVTGPDAFGPPQMIHAAGSIPGATADTWPSWSPDSKWIAFQNGINSRSDAAKPGGLYLIAPDGSSLVRLTNATGGQTGSETVYVPNFSPFNVGGYYWLTFITHRPYGNAQVGTAGAPLQQLWVAAVKNLPQPGQDPSCVPYWLPGQATNAKNISAFWAPKACRLTGEGCSVGAECCSGICAMGTCQVPPPDQCHQVNDTCGGTGDCCLGFTCNMTTHICEGTIG